MIWTNWKQGADGDIRKQPFKTKIKETKEVWLKVDFKSISHEITPTDGEKYFPKWSDSGEMPQRLRKQIEKKTLRFNNGQRNIGFSL